MTSLLGGFRSYPVVGGSVHYGYSKKWPGSRARVFQTPARTGDAPGVIHEAAPHGSMGRRHTLVGIDRVIANTVLEYWDRDSNVSEGALIGRLNEKFADRFNGILAVRELSVDTFGPSFLVTVEASQARGAYINMTWRVRVFDTSLIADAFKRMILPYLAPKLLRDYVPLGPVHPGESQMRDLMNRYRFELDEIKRVGSRLPRGERGRSQLRLGDHSPCWLVRGKLFAGTEHEQFIETRVPMRLD